MTRILIVEDERIVARDMETTLRASGHEIAGIAGNSRDAIAMAAVTNPDLVLMDIRIDGEVDGIDTARLIRERFFTPVIFLTAFADRPTVERASDTTPFGYLVKPFSDVQLHAAIEVALARHRVELHVRERERWFSSMLRAIGDGVIATDREGRVTFTNRAAESLTGLPATDLTGRSLGDILGAIGEGESTATTADAIPHVGRVMHLPGDTGLSTAGGHRRAVDTSMAPIVDDEGDALGTVAVLRDNSDRRRLQDELAMADRLTSLGIFASGLAHEINNPLTAVMLSAEEVRAELTATGRILSSLAASPDLADRLRQSGDRLAEVRDGAQRIARIISDLRMFARAGRDSCELIDPREALELAIRVALNDLDERVRVNVRLASVPSIEANEAELAQVFAIVLRNAAQAIAPDTAGAHEISISAGTDAAGAAVFAISDSGCGIPAEHLPHIFEPFFTTRAVGEGVGLGLSIAHGIVKSLRGEIRVRSTLGRGTTFEIVLPSGHSPGR